MKNAQQKEAAVKGDTRTNIQGWERLRSLSRMKGTAVYQKNKTITQLNQAGAVCVRRPALRCAQLPVGSVGAGGDNGGQTQKKAPQTGPLGRKASLLSGEGFEFHRRLALQLS